MPKKLKKCKKYALNLFLKKRTLMVIFDRKPLSNRDENGKFIISSPDLPLKDITVKKSLCECFTVNSTLYLI